MSEKTSNQLDVILKGIKGFGKFSAKPETVIVPTIFPGLNRATRVGGLASNSILLLHGPSKGGKTALALGIVISFQQNNYITLYVDAERTLDLPWAGKCGVDLDQLGYSKPDSYESTVKNIDDLIDNFKKARKSGDIDLNTNMLVVVDSLTKLIPENELEKLAKQDKNYPIRAMMNAAWLDRLNVIIGDLPILVVILAHEKKTMNASPWEEQYHIKGGDALIYDSTMQIRVRQSKTIKEQISGEKLAVAKLHHCVVKKNKVGIDGEQFYFVMSNGKGDTPIGFDIVKEIMAECGLRKDSSPMVKGSMGLYVWDGFEGGEIRGEKKVERFLNDNPDKLETLIEQLNSSATSVRVQEVNDEGEDTESEE